MSIYFLGGGNMTAAILAGMQQNGALDNVTVINRGEAKRQALAQRFGVAVGSRLPALNADDMLVLAVKPQDMAAACAGVEHGGALTVSLAAGLETAVLSRYLGGTRRLIRAMPNTPAAVGAGVTALYAADGTDAADRSRADALMSACGITLWLDDEEQMHGLTAVSGSGPAYVFYLMDALQQAAESFGFNPQQARRLVAATFEGAATLAARSDNSFAELQQQVTSKGGTTFAALETFRQHAVADSIRNGAEAAAARSQEMAAAFSGDGA